HSLISVSFLSSWLFDGSFYSNSSIRVQCAGHTSAYNSTMLLGRNFLENTGIAENASIKIGTDLWHDGQPLQISHMVPCVFDPCPHKGRSHLQKILRFSVRFLQSQSQLAALAPIAVPITPPFLPLPTPPVTAPAPAPIPITVAAPPGPGIQLCLYS